MLAEHVARVEALGDDMLVLDVGGWAAPLERADWVIDLMPFETRGLYGRSDPARERFRAETWVRRDICAREPWPFGDDQFDFVVCSHTLEDIRDPVFVCQEMARVGRAGYVEAPSWRAELMAGINGPWTGFSHHHWLVACDQERQAVEFLFKFGIVHADPWRLPFHELSETERVTWLWWEHTFSATERIVLDAVALAGELEAFVAQHRPPETRETGLRGWLRERRQRAPGP